MERAPDEDFAVITITNEVGGVADALKNYFRNEPPTADEVLLAVSPPAFAKTRVAINDITGVPTMIEMIRAIWRGAGERAATLAAARSATESRGR